ncbi:MAG: gamma-glutamyltransferase [Gemmatimonadaceae bacterium]
MTRAPHRARIAGAVLALASVATLGASCARPSTTTRGATDITTARGLPPGGEYWGDRVKPVFPAEWPYRAGGRATFAPSTMMVSDAPLASAAGVETLQRGGNAVDAAVAVGFALAVVYPEAGNIGGGGYMVIRMADGRTAALDYREVAPLAASRDMYLDSLGTMTDRSLNGPLASGVPGAVAGLLAAHRAYGRLTLPEVLAPALRYAEEGFEVDSALARSLGRAQGRIMKYAGGPLPFYPGGAAPAPGTRITQPALARTLRRILNHGTDGFYRGETARMLAAEMKRLGGIITEEDLARYKAEVRQPVTSTYRGYTLLTMPPSSSGGVTITETLNILEGYASFPAFGTAPQAHLLASAYQRAFVDRNERLADPAFVKVPIATLTSKAYAARLRAGIPADRATRTQELKPAPIEGTETTHYSVVDRQGNAVATTTTLNELYGSGVYVADAGFFLNDEMDDFAAQPGKPNLFGLVQGEANAIQPGKRMLSAMSPTIVLDSASRPFLVIGARGGPRIITSTSQVILNVIDHHMTLADAMSAPRLHHQALPDTIRYETNGMTPAERARLEQMGYALGTVGGIGLVNAIMRVPNGWHGVSDPRGSGRAIGY